MGHFCLCQSSACYKISFNFHLESLSYDKSNTHSNDCYHKKNSLSPTCVYLHMSINIHI